jgi:hypothetical protein
MLGRCTPFRARLRVPSPRGHMFNTSFRAACSHAAKARSASQVFRRSANGALSAISPFILDGFPARTYWIVSVIASYIND